MPRQIIDASKIHPSVINEIGGKPEHRQTVDEVIKAVNQHAVVIVGMKHNPYPIKAKKLLDNQGVSYHYMEYGSYFSEWKRRGALKMWSGWQTFPMIFVKGQLVGGFQDIEKLVNSGELKKLLN